jgi:hypothetical protein
LASVLCVVPAVPEDATEEEWETLALETVADCQGCKSVENGSAGGYAPDLVDFVEKGNFALRVALPDHCWSLWSRRLRLAGAQAFGLSKLDSERYRAHLLQYYDIAPGDSGVGKGRTGPGPKRSAKTPGYLSCVIAPHVDKVSSHGGPIFGQNVGAPVRFGFLETADAPPPDVALRDGVDQRRLVGSARMTDLSSVVMVGHARSRLAHTVLAARSSRVSGTCRRPAGWAGLVARHSAWDRTPVSDGWVEKEWGSYRVEEGCPSFRRQVQEKGLNQWADALGKARARLRESQKLKALAAAIKKSVRGLVALRGLGYSDASVLLQCKGGPVRSWPLLSTPVATPVATGGTKRKRARRQATGV